MPTTRKKANGARGWTGPISTQKEKAKKHARRSASYVPGKRSRSRKTHKYFFEGYDAASRKKNPGLFDLIGPGSRVTIVDRFGSQRSGRAVMRGPAGWVLNMGGKHGTPGIASPANVVRVTGTKPATGGYDWRRQANPAKAPTIHIFDSGTPGRGWVWALVTVDGSHHYFTDRGFKTAAEAKRFALDNVGTPHYGGASRPVEGWRVAKVKTYRKGAGPEFAGTLANPAHALEYGVVVHGNTELSKAGFASKEAAKRYVGQLNARGLANGRYIEIIEIDNAALKSKVVWTRENPQGIRRSYNIRRAANGQVKLYR